MSASLQTGITPATTLACAVATGVMVANIYYAQPLIGLIAPELGLKPGVAGLIVTLTQLGYGAGLLLVVPLADRFENRRLIVATLLASAASLLLVGAAQGETWFLAATVLTGLCSAGAQIVVPFAAGLAPDGRRGRTIGNVMAGLLAGIMLARPLASFLAHLGGWRTVFFVSAGLMLVLAAIMAGVLPRRDPAGTMSYGRILRSLWHIVRTTPPLRRRALYQGLIFAVFNMFWTSAPLLLAQHFGLDQSGIALFALAGAGGALTAPLAGRLGDRGYIRAGTACAIATVLACCLLATWAEALGSVLFLAAVALVLDAATQVNQVLGQRVIYGLPGEQRGRLNAAYMTVMFLLGASGSAVATLSYAASGWTGAMTVAAGLSALCLLAFATEFRRPRVA